jgi:hypothetical protein
VNAEEGRRAAPGVPLPIADRQAVSDVA